MVPFLDVDAEARLGGSLQQGGLTAQEGGDLHHVDIGSRHFGVGFVVDVSHHRHIEPLAYLCEDLQPLLVADARERVDAGAVGFLVGGLEDERYVQTVGDVDQPFGDGERTLLVLYNTRTGN